MGIQSSVNSLLSQAQSLAAFYKGFEKADKIIGDQEATKNEAQIQTEIAAGHAPMKDGKVDPEWLQKRRRDYLYNKMFDSDGKLTKDFGEGKARVLENLVKRGIELDPEFKEFYNDTRVQEYLKSFNARKKERFDSAIKAQSPNSELKNEVARNLARSSVEARTDSINKTKSNFDEHVASLIRYYGKGSGNP